jgi:hypothetical protein
MRITLQQAADIINRSPDEILYIANIEKRIRANMEADDDMVYNEDGTVSFKEGISEPTWWFDLNDVLSFKKEMDEGLVGQVENLLND